MGALWSWLTSLMHKRTQNFGDYKQQEFINFVLSKYVEDGVSELSTRKMRNLIELKYNTSEELGPPNVIRETFVGFQRFLYGA